MKDRIHRFIASEKEICLRRLEEQFKNYTENDFAVILTKIAEKQVKLSMKEKAVLSLPRVGDGSLKISQDEILEKYFDLIFPKYEQEFRKWCQKIIQDAEKNIETRIFTTLPLLISIPDLEEKVRLRCMEIVIYTIAPPEQICRIPNYESLYKAFHFHILSHLDITSAFKLYVCPEMISDIFAFQMLVSQEIGKAFDKFEKIVMEIIDEQNISNAEA